MMPELLHDSFSVDRTPHQEVARDRLRGGNSFSGLVAVCSGNGALLIRGTNIFSVTPTARTLEFPFAHMPIISVGYCQQPFDGKPELDTVCVKKIGETRRWALWKNIHPEGPTMEDRPQSYRAAHWA
jgi:hypothetical protein